MYENYDTVEVGIGLSMPNIYASKSYAEKKTGKILIGSLNKFTYAGYEFDRTPLVLVIEYLPRYNAVLGYNIHYFPEHYRRTLLKFVIEQNKNRIKRGLPMIVDYYAIKRAIPKSTHIVRMYKTIGIRVTSNIPLMSWPQAIQDKSRWENHYTGSTGAWANVKHWGDEIEDFLKKHHINF